ncbi:unnamed protein product [Darwinula stevensoni]|uniref:ELMO domain-containing protein n=1 Tax=Darwinula stevensoni TaxID=69355 RepID=A0A7R8XDR6_9CRUS|nr:unnamed protein product [Darwinula stevensoni]CAG0893335.1 unnamed protein product [Darwinula stevensoni]
MTSGVGATIMSRESSMNNIVKLAVKMGTKTPQLIKLNQLHPLTEIIQSLCMEWNVTEPEKYALQNIEGCHRYITEDNRQDIKNGAVLELVPSPPRIVEEILGKLRLSSTREEKLEALEKLEKLSGDVTFAKEFIQKGGLSLLISAVEEGKYSEDCLALVLVSFLELMELGIEPWESLESGFIRKIANYITKSSGTMDRRTIQSCLGILENLVQTSPEKYSVVEKDVQLIHLIPHLRNPSEMVQQNVIALINALFAKADGIKKKQIACITESEVKNLIVTEVLSTKSMKAEMAHQLYVLQTLLLNQDADRMNTRLDPQNPNPDATEKIKKLRTIAFDQEVESRRYADDHRKLGFENELNPSLDFDVAPPGILALDCMHYFATYHKEKFMGLVLENSCRSDNHKCPFARTSILLTRALCEILGIGESPLEQGSNFQPMFFTCEKAFEETFSICIVLLNKTWREMRATLADIAQVLSVVKEQITRTIGEKPPPETMEEFKERLYRLNYKEIKELWKQERLNREESESQAPPILELKRKLMPEIEALIAQQRLNYLVQGTRFNKFSKGTREKGKYWYCRLSPNHKVLYYGDCDERSIPSIEELSNKLPISEVENLSVGKDTPHMKLGKDWKGKKAPAGLAGLAFSLHYTSDMPRSLDFIAMDEHVFDYWTDGLNTLMGTPMKSKEYEKDLETLLSMEVKIRLLDLEGIDIPYEPPEIPQISPTLLQELETLAS